MGARISTGLVHREHTEARVLTPLGTVFVKVPGYHAEESSYPVLIEAAMDQAWQEFCNVSENPLARFCMRAVNVERH